MVAKIHLKIQGKLGQISVDSFVSVIADSLWILHALDQRISQHPRGILKWVVAGIGEGTKINNGTAYLDIDARVKRGNEDISGRVVNGFINGLQQIENDITTPSLYSPEAMIKVRSLVRSFGRNGVDGVIFQIVEEQKEAKLTIKSEKPIQELVGVNYKTLGSIEGVIELISIHKPYRKFNIYHAITGRAIKCSFPQEIEKDVFVAAQERRRVIVSGLISYNIKGEPISVFVKKPVRFLEREEELPTIQDLLGVDKDMTGDLSTEQFIRSLRDA